MFTIAALLSYLLCVNRSGGVRILRFMHELESILTKKQYFLY